MKNLKTILTFLLLGILFSANAQDTVRLNNFPILTPLNGLEEDTTIYYCSSVIFTNKMQKRETGDTAIIFNTSYSSDSIFSDTSYSWTPTSDTSIVNVDVGIKWILDGEWVSASINNNTSYQITLIRRIPNGKICWVTVDSDFKHNVIIWDTTGFSSQGVDSIKIYYSVSNTGSFYSRYRLLTTKPYNSDSNTYFEDNVNDPQNGTFQYLLTGVNSCGNIDTTSAWQTTAWISQTDSIFNVQYPYKIENDLNAVSYYVLYRDTTGTGQHWDSIYETPNQILNDPDYAKYPYAKYYVAAILNVPCAAPAIVGRSPIRSTSFSVKSKSNRVSNNHVSGIATLDSQKPNVKEYPNPFTNTINLTTDSRYLVELVDMLGRNVFTTMVEAGHNTFSVPNLSSGMYFLVVNNRVVEKLIK